MRLLVVRLVGVLALACSAPSPTPTPLITPEPGIIRFGTTFDRESGELTRERRAFRPTDKITYVAVFRRPSGTRDLDVILARPDGAPLVEINITVPTADVDLAWSAFELSEFGPMLGGPGEYVMWIFPDEEPTALAYGEFEITP